MTNDELRAAYKARALEAVRAYREGKYHGTYPAPRTTGQCGAAARALWEEVHGQFLRFIGGSATAKLAAMEHGEHHGDKRVDVLRAVPNSSAYHAAAATGRLRVGAMVFFGGNRGLGHVVTIIDITGDPAKSLADVITFENTSRERAGIPMGTCIATLADVCQVHGGSSGILAIANVEAL